MSSLFSKLGLRFLPHLHFNCRHFCNYAKHDRIFMDYAREQCELGFHNLQFPIILFHRMMSIVPRPFIIDFNQLFAAMLKLKRLQPYPTVISLYSRLELSGIRPNLHSMSILANCYSHLGRVDFGYSLLAKSLKLGYPFESDLILFNTLINGHVHNDQLPEAVKLLEVAVVKFGIQPDIVTSAIMVKGLCGTGDNAGALDVLRGMNSHPNGCKPGVVIYNTLIDGLLKDKLVKEALSLFSVMKTEGIKPDVFTYNSVIRGMFNLGRKGEAKKILAEMMESNIEPDISTYNMLVDMHCKDMMTREAEAILPTMIKRRLTPDLITYNTLMNGYCLCGQMDKARDLMDLMVKDHCQPDVVTFCTLINGFVKHQRIEKALDILREMWEHGIFPDEWLYNILIDGLYRAGRVEDAENLVSDILSRGLAPSLTIRGRCRKSYKHSYGRPKSFTK